jgi:hypothetical protein
LHRPMQYGQGTAAWEQRLATEAAAHRHPARRPGWNLSGQSAFDPEELVTHLDDGRFLDYS